MDGLAIGDAEDDAGCEEESSIEPVCRSCEEGADRSANLGCLHRTKVFHCGLGEGCLEKAPMELKLGSPFEEGEGETPAHSDIKCQQLFLTAPLASFGTCRSISRTLRRE